jgi:hypothetical protein
MDTSLPIVKTRGGEDKLLEAAEVHFPNEMELAHRVPEESKPRDAANDIFQWTGQETMSEEDTRELLRSPYSAAAPTLHMLALVDPPPAHSHLCPNMEFEPQRWRPPDHA